MTQAIITVGNIFSDAFEGLMDLYKEKKANAQERALARQTKRELSGLTDRELNDLGIGRSDITSIANGTFHKNVEPTIEQENANLRGWV